VRRFVSRFPGRVGLVHSGLSPGERYDTWRRARQGRISIVVGPRSALFTPFDNLGLIVVDECHDDSYYQSEIPPHYHAREVAIIYARLAGAVCLLGSATPDIVSRYKADQGNLCYLHLPARILAHRQAIQTQIKHLQARAIGRPPRYRHLEGQAETAELPEVEIVDMREELKAGNKSIFSRSLQSALAEVLSMEEQAILFLNRRGTATYVFCRDCGYTVRCPRCEMPLTYHAPRTMLTCHHCGYERKLPKTCPQCGSQRIRQFGTGTERVESELLEIFPQARTLRWDYDTTRKKGAHEIILSHFANQRADILIGTQMIAKGLDLPLVTLVGVVLAEVGLNLPDLRASERTFQVLTQVAGRAGRSPLGGRVFLQTFQPDHYVIQTAAKHDYHAFYETELGHRRQLGYPPFTRLVRLEVRHADPDRVAEAAFQLADEIKNWIVQEKRRATEMIGPVPCFYARIGGLYRWQIVLRGPDPVSLLRGRNLADWHIEVEPPSLL
jgi:primosomal protein N' (replication factor Y)